MRIIDGKALYPDVNLKRVSNMSTRIVSEPTNVTIDKDDTVAQANTKPVQASESNDPVQLNLFDFDDNMQI